MSPERGWPLRLQDILGAIAEAREFIAGMDRDAFFADPKTQRACIMNIAIIGEAAKHVPDDVRLRYHDVPWHLITAMRNVIVHTYFRIDVQLVWDTLTRDLPELERALSPLGPAFPVE